MSMVGAEDACFAGFMRFAWSSCLCGVLLAGCTPAVAEGGTSTAVEGSSGTDPLSESSTSGDPDPSTTTTTTTEPDPTSGAEPTTSGDPLTGSDSTTSSSGGRDTSSGETGDESTGSTTGVPLPAGCEEHLELEISALSAQTDGPTWEPGESITINFSLFNAAVSDNGSYPSVYVESDTEGVTIEQPIFSWFAIFAGQTFDGALLFSSAESITVGTEVVFTAHVATLTDPCPGISTRTVTATVQ